MDPTSAKTFLMLEAYLRHLGLSTNLKLITLLFQLEVSTYK